MFFMGIESAKKPAYFLDLCPRNKAPIAKSFFDLIPLFQDLYLVTSCKELFILQLQRVARRHFLYFPLIYTVISEVIFWGIGM